MNATNQKNTLLLACGDQRLGAKFLAAMEEVLGKKFYILMVPGPDAGVMGDKEHEMATIFFVKRFYDLTNFDELVTVTHEDCAGCQCDTKTHEQNTTTLTRRATVGIGFEGACRHFIARRPEADDFEVWEVEELEDAEKAVIAA